MRLELLLSYFVTILIAVGISWWISADTTKSEFTLLIAENNANKLDYVSSIVLDTYQQERSWQAIQEKIARQNQQIVDWNENWQAVLPEQAGAVLFSNPGIEFNQRFQRDALPTIGTATIRASGEDWMPIEIFPPNFVEILSEITIRSQTDSIIFSMPSNPTEQIEIRTDEVFSTPLALSTNFFRDSEFLTGLLFDLSLDNQRLLVVDGSGEIVVDSDERLLAKEVDESLLENGFTIYDEQGEILGTVIVTLKDNTYTIEQQSFLDNVKQGLLFGGLIGCAVAAIFALIITEPIIRPIRSLTKATQRLMHGEWGIQVTETGRNEIKTLSLSFNEMSQNLVKQRQLRTRLVNDLAHEINTPLNLIRMEIQGFLDGLQSPEDTAKHLENELDQVADLMDDLIFLASSDSSRRLMLDWVDAQELILQTVERFQGVPSMGRKIDYTLPSESIRVYADAELVQRAISNLLSNALRYTTKDGVISVQLASSLHEICITVQDNGCGIAEEHLPHIFDRFYRTDESRNATSGGRGLGLAIVQQIMEEHQGRVQIESQVGQGTTVTLIFPITATAP